MPYITGETFQQHLPEKIPMQDGPEPERVDFCDPNQLIWILCFFRFIRFRLFAHLRAVADTHKVRCPKVPHQTIVSKVNYQKKLK